PPPRIRLRGQSPRSKRNTESWAISQERHAGRSRGEVEAELAQGALVRPPLVAHPHRQLEEHLDAEEPFQVLARRGADLLEGRAALADEDALLRVVLHEDARSDVQTLRALAFGQLLHPHRAGVGHLLMGEAEDLLADGLGDPEGLWLVRERLPREAGRPLGHAAQHKGAEAADAPSRLPSAR